MTYEQIVGLGLVIDAAIWLWAVVRIMQVL